MKRRNWSVVVLALGFALILAATVVPAGEEDEATYIAPGECSRGPSCQWCVFDVERTTGEECPELEQICLVCDQESPDCPEVRELVLKDKDCTFLVELSSRVCEDCPRGIPTFVR